MNLYWNTAIFFLWQLLHYNSCMRDHMTQRTYLHYWSFIEKSFTAFLLVPRFLPLECKFNSNLSVVCIFTTLSSSTKGVARVQQRKKESEVSQSCPTLWDTMDYKLPASSVHGIFQARVLEWGAISFSRVFFWPRDRNPVFRVAGRHFTIWATREAQHMVSFL